MIKVLRFFSYAVLLVIASGCATKPPLSDPDALAYYNEINDPFEPLNRSIFSFNNVLNNFLFYPIAKAYRDYLPDPLTRTIRNFLHNLDSPNDAFNDLLQGKTSDAGNTITRLLINSTIGIGGLFDPATGMGYEWHDNDFGKTMAIHGVGEGFYVVIPILGPSTIRHGTGIGVDIIVDPMHWYLFVTDQNLLSWSRFGMDGVIVLEGLVDDLEEMERSSIDYYAALRSYYRQNRAEVIREGTAESEKGRFDDIYDELDMFDEFDEFDESNET